MKNLLIATMLTSAAFTGAAIAQTDPATAPAATTPAAPGAEATATEGAMTNEGGFVTYQEGSQLLASGLMGADVRGADGESIGTVDDLLLDTDGQIQAVVVGIGGFLGVGQRDVAIANDQLEFVLAQDAAAADGAAAPEATGSATAPAAAPADTGATGAAGTSPATGTTGGAMAPAAPAGGTGMATGTGTGTAGDSGWGWSGAGIDHITVNYTRDQLENAPEFESAE